MGIYNCFLHPHELEEDGADGVFDEGDGAFICTECYSKGVKWTHDYDLEYGDWRVVFVDDDVSHPGIFMAYQCDYCEGIFGSQKARDAINALSA